MKTIWKFALKLEDEQTVQMPAGAELLDVQDQGFLMLWALVDPDAPEVVRCIRVIGTGYPITDYAHLSYVATVQQAGGNLVWHIFDKGEA